MIKKLAKPVNLFLLLLLAAVVLGGAGVTIGILAQNDDAQISQQDYMDANAPAELVYKRNDGIALTLTYQSTSDVHNLYDTLHKLDEYKDASGNSYSFFRGTEKPMSIYFADVYPETLVIYDEDDVLTQAQAEALARNALAPYADLSGLQLVHFEFHKTGYSGPPEAYEEGDWTDGEYMIRFDAPVGGIQTPARVEANILMNGKLNNCWLPVPMEATARKGPVPDTSEERILALATDYVEDTWDEEILSVEIGTPHLFYNEKMQLRCRVTCNVSRLSSDPSFPVITDCVSFRFDLERGKVIEMD